MAEAIQWLERVFLMTLSGLVVWRVAPQISEHPQLAIFLISEVVGVVLLLAQRRGSWSTKPYPVIIAFFGTAVALLVVPQGVRVAPAWISVVLIFSGAIFALLAKVSLGRSFGIVPANRGVKENGVYRLVRHPMYAGYILNHAGFLLMFFSPFNVAVYALCWTALWLRTREEEKFLAGDEAYRNYQQKVRYRLVPGVV